MDGECHTGDMAAARDQYAVLMPIRERVSGLEHRSTLTDGANLASWTGAAGDAAGAPFNRAETGGLVTVSDLLTRGGVD